MKITLRHFMVPFLPILAGGLLAYLGLAQGWGVVWASGGVFFILLGLCALTLSVAWISTGTLGTVLRSPAVSIAILAIVLGSLCVTVYLAAVQNAG